jgi:TPR repeat protein
VFLAIVGLAAPARADTQSGLVAFQAGRFSEAFQAWHVAADHGDATAALYLGVLYDTGIGVPQGSGQALVWYQRGTEDGSPTAILNVGVMYDSGRGAALDPESAATWYERAGSAGNGRAEYNLALMYEAGSGAPASRLRAVQFYRAAASHGVSAAGTRLRELGLATRAPPRPAEDPAMSNFRQAQSVLLERGVGDAAEAFKFFRSAAEAGNALAAYNLAYYYQHGIGVRANAEEAVTWYRRSEAAATDNSIKELARSGLRSAQASVAHAQR